MIRVLLVDDNPDILDVYRVGLRMQGLEVSVAGSAADALTAISEQRPDVVVEDVFMPEVDGLELARRLRADPETCGIPLIVLSAGSFDVVHAGFSDLGVCTLYEKPVTSEELAARIREVVRAEGRGQLTPTPERTQLSLGGRA
jgi:DNA-binding response OmpR family regulator